MSDNQTSSALGQAFVKMTERERKLVALTVAVAVVFALGGLFWIVSGAIKSREADVASKRQWLQNAEQMRVAYGAAKARQEAAQNRLRLAGATSLSKKVQDDAASLGVTVKDQQERSLPVKDSDVTEVTVDLNVKELSTDKLVELLEKIEGKSAGGVVKVQKLKVKTRLDTPEILEANIGVSTWKLPAATGTPATAPTPNEEKKP
jgi:hypothetical protein